MIEVAKLKSSFNGWMAYVTFRPERASKHGSNGWPLETQVMSSQSVQVFRSCESTMDLVTGCISKSEGES